MRSILKIFSAALCISLGLGFTAKAQSNALQLKVFGNCGMCKERIEKAAQQVKGVKSADWDTETQNLTIQYNIKSFDKNLLLEEIVLEGHDTEELIAFDDIYEELHGCCKYRENPDYVAFRQANPNIAVLEEAHHGQLSDNHHEVTNKGHNHGMLQGVVKAYDEKQRVFPLPGASIYWAGTSIGTTTNEQGNFSIPVSDESKMLVYSYVGYESDTVLVVDIHNFNSEFIFEQTVSLDEVQVVERQKTTEISFIDPIKTFKITEKELQKAACCNLSESFETNPSVDVSFTDAVTGTRQIEMLGLAGPYVQITRENMPNIRGLSSIYGFTYIPGPWMEGIQLNMGTGSVVNGFESVTGQINVELKKPEQAEKVYLNLFASEGGRLEGNANFTHKFNPNFYGGLFLHVKNQQMAMDRNNDQFLDHPLSEQYIAMNRYKFFGKNGLEGQFGFKATVVDNESGQALFHDETTPSESPLWKAFINTRRYETWLKTGRVFPNNPSSSVGFQFSAMYHDQDAVFGERTYNALQKNLYGNLIYQNLIGEHHELKAGASFQYDVFDEYVVGQDYAREEAVPGVFGEYSYNVPEKITIVAGIRADHHNNYGLFFTPRLHFRFVPFEETILRLSAGKGLRTASVFAENIGAFASNRDFVVHSNPENENPYGLKPEEAWNFGANITKYVDMFIDKELVLGVDFYHTRFVNQIVVDYDQHPQEINLYNLEGKSYSNSLQAQADMEVFRNFDVRLAYRFNDVKTDFLSGLKEKSLTSRNRAFINLAYGTDNGWKFDYTLNYQGPKRIPETDLNPEQYQLADYSPDFFLSNAQISKSWKEGVFDIYLGVENLFNYTQDNPILASGEPFGNYFDSSMIWGPVFGRNVYLGLRYKIF